MHFNGRRNIFFYLILIPLVICRILEEREVICSSDRMVVNLSFIRPFNGIVYADNFFGKDDCRWKGNGGHYLLLIVPFDYTNSTVEEKGRGFCGLKFNQEDGKHSITFVVTPDPMILTDETFSLTTHCIQTMTDITLTLPAPILESNFKIKKTDTVTVMGNSSSPALSLRLLEDHGLTGEVILESTVGKRLTLDAQLQDTSIFDMFLHDCIAHDGTHSDDATISVVDAKGCAVKLQRAVDEPVFTTSPQQNSSKHIYVHIYGFQFTTSDAVYFECKATVCVNECPMRQCIPAVSSLSQNRSLDTFTIRSALKMTPQILNSKSQAMHLNGGENECLEPTTAGIVAIGALAVFIILSYFTRKLIYSYRKFLSESR